MNLWDRSVAMRRLKRGYQNNLLSNGTPAKNRTPEHLVQSYFVECPDYCPIKAVASFSKSTSYLNAAGDVRDLQRQLRSARL